MERSNPWGDLYQMWHLGRHGGRNHVCNISWLSVKGCGCGERGKFAFSHWHDVSPLQHWSHYRVTVWFVCGRHNAAWQLRSRNSQDWDLGCLEATGWAQESLAFLDAAVQLLHVRGAVAGSLSCWNTKSLADTLLIAGSSMTSLWRREAAPKKSISKIYHQKFLFCNNNEIAACIADLFNSFCEEVYAVTFLR